MIRCSKCQYINPTKCSPIKQICFVHSKCNRKKPKSKIISVPEVNKFIVECLRKLNVKDDKACILAKSLVKADYQGILSHGLNRLEHYIIDIKNKNCNPNADPKIISESASAAAVCGNNGLGAVIGVFCINIAIEKACKTGIAMVVANGSNHFGVNSFYTEHAVSQGCIGMAFTNTSPLMVPTGAKKACFGTNPMSIAAPAGRCDRVVIDFATTSVSLGKIEMYRRRNQKIPIGWALDKHGKPTTDPAVAVKARRLSPLGGTASHKGTGLAIMVEILSGLLANSTYGPNVRVWGQKPFKPANLGHGFIVINPRRFISGFEKRLGDLLEHVRKLEPADPKRPMLVPGDMERAKMKKVDEQGGIEYTNSHLKMIQRLVQDLGVKPPKFKS